MHFTGHLTHLCKKLLQPKKAKRLGNMKDGIDGIQNHPWFEAQGVEWGNLRSHKTIAPYVPPTKDLDDAGAFKSLKDEQVPPDDMSRWTPKF